MADLKERVFAEFEATTNSLHFVVEDCSLVSYVQCQTGLSASQFSTASDIRWLTVDTVEIHKDSGSQSVNFHYLQPKLPHRIVFLRPTVKPTDLFALTDFDQLSHSELARSVLLSTVVATLDSDQVSVPTVSFTSFHVIKQVFNLGPQHYISPLHASPLLPYIEDYVPHSTDAASSKILCGSSSIDCEGPTRQRNRAEQMRVVSQLNWCFDNDNDYMWTASYDGDLFRSLLINGMFILPFSHSVTDFLRKYKENGSVIPDELFRIIPDDLQILSVPNPSMRYCIDFRIARRMKEEERRSSKELSKASSEVETRISEEISEGDERPLSVRSDSIGSGAAGSATSVTAVTGGSDGEDSAMTDGESRSEGFPSLQGMRSKDSLKLNDEVLTADEETKSSVASLVAPTATVSAVYTDEDDSAATDLDRQQSDDTLSLMSNPPMSERNIFCGSAASISSSSQKVIRTQSEVSSVAGSESMISLPPIPSGTRDTIMESEETKVEMERKSDDVSMTKQKKEDLTLSSSASMSSAFWLGGQTKWSRFRKLRKFGKHFYLSMNAQFVKDLDMCRKYHIEKEKRKKKAEDESGDAGHTWLNERMIRLLCETNEMTCSDKGRSELPLKMVTFELWDQLDLSQPCAASFGFAVGRVLMDYTFMTLNRDRRSCGSILTRVVGDMLEQCGFDLWYWGFKLDYMSEYDSYGGCLVSSQDFLNILRDGVWDCDTHEKYREMVDFVQSGKALVKPLPSWLP